MGSYSYIIYNAKKILNEQLWVIAYFCLLILFQNPIYCVIVWYRTPPTVGASFSSYVLSYFSQSGLFMLWLLFVDSIHRKTSSKLMFYTRRQNDLTNPTAQHPRRVRPHHQTSELTEPVPMQY
jgi:hypothetical protein